MKYSTNDDSPIFPTNAGYEKSDKSDKSDDLALKQFNADNSRKNKILKFSMESVRNVLGLTALLLLFDIIIQYFKLDNSLIREVFSVLKYSLTTILGYIFAISKKS